MLQPIEHCRLLGGVWVNSVRVSQVQHATILALLGRFVLFLINEQSRYTLLRKFAIHEPDEGEQVHPIATGVPTLKHYGVAPFVYSAGLLAAKAKCGYSRNDGVSKKG